MERNIVDEINVEEVIARIDDLMNRKSKFNGYRWRLDESARNVGFNFNGAKFHKTYIAPIEEEIKTLLKFLNE